ncbi:hypothetical protein D9619_007909 [Psilocybe cf. subviscida]|uniref:Aminoglycoside phosphotransferase domain-containing protein n=1 Tax=Psilocybe cf. subviscida TaxID=2480587 RepID=A0A8H5ATV0_9AGAR|nr:hypothetical protein D9619_007909 [Psilocybe cf. subviscida]
MGHSMSTFRDPPPSTECQSSINALSDDQVYALIDAISDEDAIGFKESSGTLRDSEVHRITHNAVVKYGHAAETFAMTYVSSHTSIPIPRIRRVLPVIFDEDPNYTPDGEWIVMDLIDGEPLVTAWPTLSWWRRLRVIWYMRSYMRQLRSVPIPVPDQPGPMHPSGKPMVCWGAYFAGAGSGPFHSYKEMADWYDRCRFHGMVVWHQTEGEILRCLKFDRTHPLVICHMDLNMRNIMVDRKGIPWIIDWGEAGVYPTWFEYCRATCWIRPSASPEWRAPWLWRWSVTLMFGNFRKYLTDFFDPLAPLWTYGIEDWPTDYFKELGIDVD